MARRTFDVIDICEIFTHWIFLPKEGGAHETRVSSVRREARRLILVDANEDDPAEGVR